MMHLALDAAYALLAAATAPWWMRKARGGWRERFGHVAALPAPTRPRLLLHAVSVGEVNLTRPLIPLLLPHAEVVLSVTTDTGIERARALYERGGAGASGVKVVRYPLDASASVRRFLDAIKPTAVALVELELWPNFVRTCRARGIPVAVVNGRLSARSFKRYHAARALIGGVFRQLRFAAVQDHDYAARFGAMGVDASRVRVCGSMKWDAADLSPTVAGADELARELDIDRARPLIVAGSTEPVEHALLHRAVPAGTQLLCAPRKPEWFDQAAADLPGCVRLSDVRGGTRTDLRTSAQREPRDRYLLDTIGDLRKAYALADVIVIGRSFGALYGSDPMEAAALGKPVVIGPRVADFESAVAALAAADGIVQTSADALPGVLASLLRDSSRREALSKNARACVEANRGAAARHASLLLEMMGVRAGSSITAAARSETTS
jgi:3-deoxy-D-manno-octulosonic-acid transferase